MSFPGIVSVQAGSHVFFYAGSHRFAFSVGSHGLNDLFLSVHTQRKSCTGDLAQKALFGKSPSPDERRSPPL